MRKVREGALSEVVGEWGAATVAASIIPGAAENRHCSGFRKGNSIRFPFRMSQNVTFNAFKELVATQLNIPVRCQRFWSMTLRPDFGGYRPQVRCHRMSEFDDCPVAHVHAHAHDHSGP